MTKPKLKLKANGTFYWLAFKWIRYRGRPVEEVWIGPYSLAETAYWAAKQYREMR